MATAKKNNYASIDLEWAEQQIFSWKAFMDANPYEEVEDRKELMQSKTGGSYYTVVQTREQIQKSLRDTMKEFLAMMEVVKKLREDEQKKIETRGKTEVSSQAAAWLADKT